MIKRRIITTTTGAPFRLMDKAQKGRLIDNITAAMQGLKVETVKRQLAHFSCTDPDYGSALQYAWASPPLTYR